MLNLFEKTHLFARFNNTKTPATLLGFAEQKKLEKKYEDIDPYLEIMEDAGQRLSIMSGQTIQPTRNQPLGGSPKKARRQWGKPVAFFAQNGLLNTDTAVHFASFMGYRARLELSYFQDQLFGFSCYFLDAQTTDHSLIIEALGNQYDVNLTNPNIQKIIDSQGNTILINDKEELQLHFYHIAHPLFEQLKTISVFYNRKTQRKQNEMPLFGQQTALSEKAKPVGY